MDCQMPEMDGYEATRRIPDSGSGVLDHRIPVIAMTAGVLEKDREKCMEAGMDDFVTKPVKLQGLEEVINRQDLLERLMHDEGLVAEVIEAFLEDAPQRIALLKEAFRRGDAAVVEREAHTLKGAAGNVSAVALRELALEAEQAGAAWELDRVASLIAKIDEQFDILKKTVAHSELLVPAAKR